jgi:hypothetical protein
LALQLHLTGTRDTGAGHMQSMVTVYAKWCQADALHIQGMVTVYAKGR